MRYLPLATLLFLGACSNPGHDGPDAAAPMPGEPMRGSTCSAAGVQYAVGRKTSVDLGSTLVAESGAATLRWMPPRSAATMDYRQDRLNIAYDDDMIITRIECG